MSMELVLKMAFLTFSNADIQFAKKELSWSTYTTEDVLPTSRRVKPIDKKEFAKAALAENVEAFVVHAASFISKMTIHLAWEAQIALLLAKKVTVLAEYIDFVDIFSKALAKVLSERTDINEHVIK